MESQHLDVSDSEGLRLTDDTLDPDDPSQVIGPPEDDSLVGSDCRHKDIRIRDQGRTCLACGEAGPDLQPRVRSKSTVNKPAHPEEDDHIHCQHPDIRKTNDYRTCLACGEIVFNGSLPTIAAADDCLHRYRPLNYTLDQEIRLINLLPGESSDSIRCQMLHVNLDDDPAYEAVSYTWATEDGDASLSKAVYFVDSKQFAPVTENCEAALRQLRKRGCSRRLWIDAICIDQTNVNERNHQVGLMDNIYSKAWRVLICLQDDGFDAVQEYMKLFNLLRSGGRFKPRMLPTVERLLSARYFQRVWVIQEIALARSAYLLVNEHELDLCPLTLSTFETVCSENDIALPEVLRWIPGRPEYDIVTCLASGANCAATDPKDNVFALLSLMEPRARAMIPLDYSLSVQCVEAFALIAIFVSTGTLEHLRYVPWSTGLPLGYNRLHTFQSFPQFKDSMLWQPTVRVNVVERLTPDSSNRNMAAACSVTIEKPSMRTVMGQFPRLRIRAHYIDTVRVTNLVRRRANNGAIAVNNAGDPFPAPNWQGRSPAGDVLVAHDLVTNLEEYPQLLAGDYRWMLDYFKTVVELPKRVEWSSEDTFTNLKDKDLPFVNLHDLRTFVNAIKLHLALLDNWSSRRASFVFATVYSLGFGGRGFHVGDQIWAVDGVTVPLILRKAGSEYKLIGECYLWAALNLDRWTPGTKKGRWLDSYESSPGRTRMIVLDGTANSGRVS